MVKKESAILFQEVGKGYGQEEKANKNRQKQKEIKRRLSCSRKLTKATVKRRQGYGQRKSKDKSIKAKRNKKKLEGK